MDVITSMKILPLQYTMPNKQTYVPIKSQKNITNTLGNYNYLNFYGAAPRTGAQSAIVQSPLTSAINYLKNTYPYGLTGTSYIDLNFDKINGIQTGIKTFEGLSMKEIKMILENLSVIMVKRGCSSRCSHCACDAVPQHYKKDSSYTETIPWEDFEEFINGYSKLKNRLGYEIIYPGKEISLFHDADCVELEMKDKDGKVYDFADTCELLLTKTPSHGLFDTSGWNPKSERLQKRAEKIVRFLGKNTFRMNQINISINPFHALLEKSYELTKAGDTVNAELYRGLYTDRMANAIFTFSPVIDATNFILRSKSKDRFRNETSLMQIQKEIIEKLRIMYLTDITSNQKYVKNETEIDEILRKISNKSNKKSSEIAKLGRAEKFFKSSYDDSIWKSLGDKNEFFGDLKRKTYETYIDANGQVYVSNSYLISPTKMQLNFSNKDKKTIPPAKLIDQSKINVANNIIDKFILET